MKVGFTGTREGMTLNQRSQFWSWLSKQGATSFRQGCCIGADSQAAYVASKVVPRPTIVGHLSNLQAQTCPRAVGLCDDTVPPEPPLVRNHDIVDACDVLAACPRGPEERRSGTWATVRFARTIGRRVVIFWPDGTVTEEQNNTGGRG
jgi:hypothetical protein